ncbi:MAG: EFR1 family ferrodoxin [Bacillota bacterium]|nr:EFR1 family ferrodoxin [Bacillota bacterium]
MIFYFSGTGNSLQVAKNISEFTGERLVSVSNEMANSQGSLEYTLADSERIGFVFPIYAWAPPKMVLDFIKQLKLHSYSDNYVFSIATCGDNIGNAMKLLAKTLRKVKLPLHSGFSVRMPNNYIIMFDVDSKEVERQKLEAAQRTLEDIRKIISERKRDVFQVVKGSFPGILTGLVNPPFNKLGINTKKFYADDKCTGCGMCERVCNCRNISVQGKPRWGDRCSQCLACLHYCPVKAVQYGKKSSRKGRYTNPNVNIQDFI